MRHTAAKDYLLFRIIENGYSAAAQHIDTVRNWYGNDRGREMAAAMFAVLQIRPQENGFLQKIKVRMHPARPQAIQVAVKGGTPFLCVEASRRKGGLPWEEIAFCAGRCAGRMLLPDGVIPPEGGPVKAFLPDALAPLILFNTACDVLARRRRPPGEECITLLDPQGRLARRAGRLLAFASLVRVVTDNTAVYEQTAEQVMEDYGAALLVQDTFAGARDSTVVIAPDGLRESFFPKRKCAVFTNRESRGGYLCITAEGIDLPEPYCRLIPDGINPDRFAGALYEASGLRELSRRTYTRLKLYGTTTNPDGAARMLSAVREEGGSNG